MLEGTKYAAHALITVGKELARPFW